MKKLTISFLGRDCPGAVSTVSQILGQSGCNIVEVTQTILSGEFAAIFIVQAPDTLEQEELRRLLLTGLEAAGQDLLGLGAYQALQTGAALDPTKNACPPLRTDVAIY